MSCALDLPSQNETFRRQELHKRLADHNKIPFPFPIIVYKRVETRYRVDPSEGGLISREMYKIKRSRRNVYASQSLDGMLTVDLQSRSVADRQSKESDLPAGKAW